MTIFIDTNILLYSISKVPEDAAKREMAEAMLLSSDCVMSVQVLNEFVVQSTRVSRVGHITFEQAVGLVRGWRRFTVQPLDEALFDMAVALKRQANYSWWDSLIVAAAIAQGCDTLATEDMQHGRVIDGVRIVNPFRDLA